MPQNNEIILPDAEARYSILMPKSPSDDMKYRIGRYFDYLDESGQSWLVPNLQLYGEWLRDTFGLKNRSINSLLGTVRGRYRKVMIDNDFRRWLLARYRREQVLEWLDQLNNAVNPSATDFDVITNQDATNRLRLSIEQVSTLLSMIDNVRDNAIIRLILATGIREAELCSLTVADVKFKYEGKKYVHIPIGKGLKERRIPTNKKMYDFFMPAIDAWLSHAMITEGVLFRRIYKSGRVGDSALSPRSIEWLLAENYQMEIDDQMTVIKPHDLRATYARRAYEDTKDILAVARNMGHSRVETTWGYVGDVDMDSRDFDNFYGVK